VVRAIGSSPEEPYSLIYATLLSAIGSAETSVHLTNAYFAPDPQLLTALEAAVGRGVDVTLILPSQTDSCWCSTLAAPTTAGCCAPGSRSTSGAA
jgi:cardiolipin synthase